MNSKKVLITGASGFVGSATVIRMNKLNFIVRCISGESILKSQLKFHGSDNFVNKSISPKINWAELLSDVSCIIHCAAKSIDNNKEDNTLHFYRKSNVELTYNIAKLAAFFGVKRFIFLSSIGVNGPFLEKSESFNINDTPKPIGNYQISKWEAEQALIEISNQTGLETVIIRAPLIYGEGVKGNFLKLLDLIYREIPLPFASIDNLKSLISLENLVDLIIKCIDNPNVSRKTLLVSDGEDISTPDLLKKLSKFMKKSSRVFSVPIPIIKLMSNLVGKKSDVNKIIGSLRIDNSYACEILKWNPVISLNEGLEKTTRWYLKNR
jgi:nucleoside-diphosphate-sugar epimerase